ncbi:MAG: folate-binding protein YgfZ [Proteobacteria bacterium]|nr:folate-binding protein YgfZ [Pseudomonadota bacterium]
MTSVAGSLDYLGVLELGGADAIGFLQGQITNDARRLAGGECILAALCTPQGRVIALMRAFLANGRVLALLPRELIAGVHEGLRRYVLRAKVTLSDRSEDLKVVGLPEARRLGEVGLAPPPPGQALTQEGLNLTAVPGDAARALVIGSEQLLNERLPGWREQRDFESRWKLADIRAGLPQVYAATRETFVPQMLNLDLLDGIRFDKGCYTGQEIVARTQHLGRIKRRLFILDLPAGDYHVGDTLRLDDGRGGRLVEYASVDGAHQGLAVFSLEPGGDLVSGDTEAGSARLPAGAARLAASP